MVWCKTKYSNPKYCSLDVKHQSINHSSYLCFSVYLTIMGDNSYITKTPGNPDSPVLPPTTFECFVTEYWFVFKIWNKNYTALQLKVCKIINLPVCNVMFHISITNIMNFTSILLKNSFVFILDVHVGILLKRISK